MFLSQQQQRQQQQAKHKKRKNISQETLTQKIACDGLLKQPRHESFQPRHSAWVVTPIF